VNEPLLACPLCGEAIEGSRTRGVYFRVLGWEKDRDAGGTNALRCRERTGEVAHAHCVDREASRVSASQLTI
jgi:hypothetical protein